MTYFDLHYSRVNDLSPEGRRRMGFDFERIYGPLVPSRPDARVLDFGCGAGVFLEWLVRERRLSRAVGVDIDRSQVDFARSIGVDATWSVAPHEWLRTQPPFDAIFMLDVLEHLDDELHARTLAAVHAALVPGASLVVHVPNANSSFAGRFRYIDPTHVRSYTEITIEGALRGAGFREVTVRSDDVNAVRSPVGAARLALRGLTRLGRRLEALAEFGPAGWRLPLSPNMVAIARTAP